MINFIVATFKWLPTPLFLLVSAVFTFFSIFVAVALIKALLQIIQFVVKALGGVLGKVAALFV